MTGTHLDYYEKLLWLLSLPYGCYMKYCGGQTRAATARKKLKEERAAKRRAAGLRRSCSEQELLEEGSMVSTNTAVVRAEAVKSELVFITAVEGGLSRDMGADLDLATEGNSQKAGAQPQHKGQGASSTICSKSAWATTDLGFAGMTSDVRYDEKKGKRSQDMRENQVSEAGVQDTDRDANSTCHTDAPRTRSPVSDTVQQILMGLEERIADPRISQKHIKKAVSFKDMKDAVKHYVSDINTAELRDLFDECDTNRVIEGEICDNLGDQTS